MDPSPSPSRALARVPGNVPSRDQKWALATAAGTSAAGTGA